ncbi:proton myo-inositol cotransporter-like isoform X2 [Oratosquilla oratoria]|uniref:proton myo-inositol cotransporter-like isoform X2 n=1 Tax=Oratosquilla oratoria TaxID=337810 RepID=UPI003F770D42
MKFGGTSEERQVLGVSPTPQPSLFIYVLAFFSALGGFLFGYDTGVVSGSMLIIRKEFELSTMWHEMIVSGTIGAAWVAALIGGPLTDMLGRKVCILVASMVFTVGGVLMGVADTKELLLVGRIVVGLGIGLASMSVPMFLSEAAPPELRGRLTVTNTVFITGGQFFASVMCGAFASVDNGWRWMLGLGAIPAAIQFIGFLFLPESPRWLLAKGRREDARKVLSRLRGTTTEAVAQELDAIAAALAEDANNQGGHNVIREVFTSAAVMRALLVGALLQLFQQISGINTVMYYSASIVTMAGIRDPTQAIWVAAALSSINFLCTFIGLYLVERVGRRHLTLGSLAGVVCALTLLALSFQLADMETPSVGSLEKLGGPCGDYRYCADCTHDTNCGFCFQDIKETMHFNSSCLPTNHDSFNEISSEGLCANSSTMVANDIVFAYDWCPSSYAWLSILGLCFYLFCFAPGMGPMPWTINSEIYPLWARSTCNSITTSVNWGSNLVVSITFLTLTEVIHKHGAFYLYAVLALVGFVIFYMILPETKGLRLEEIEGLFARPLCSKNGSASAQQENVQYVHIRGLNRDYQNDRKQWTTRKAVKLASFAEPN